MEEDIYKQFTDQLRSSQPQLKAKEELRKRVLNSIATRDRGKKRLIVFLRSVASILLMLGIGSYAWMELSSQQSRSILISKTSDCISIPDEHWQCRQSISTLISSLKESDVFLFENNKVLLTKGELKDLKQFNNALYQKVVDFLHGLENNYPTVYQAYLAGEEIQLSTWQLRKEYKVCDWLTY